MMIHSLRHFTVRLWLSLLLASLIVFTGFPVFGGQAGLHLAFWIALGIFLLLFFLVGWLGNALGLRWVGILMREAGIWERAGNARQSEKIFGRAVSIFDSFLISPLAREANAREISSRMARFYLAQIDLPPRAEAFLIGYLHRHPDDAEVSDLWLQKSGALEALSGKHAELAFKLSDAQPENDALQRQVARACLASDRSDYLAFKTYKRILEQPAGEDRRIVDDIAWRFYQDRRTDRWALTAYMSAFRADKKKTILIKAIAACSERATVSDRESQVYRDAAALLSRLDDTVLARMRTGFVAAAAKEAVAPVKKERLRSLVQRLRLSASSARTALLSAGRTAIGTYSALYHGLKSHRLSRPAMKWSALGLAGIGLAALVINTAGHLISSRRVAPPLQPQTPVVVEVTDPFTLQVAAYLKVEHADKFVATLRELGEDAYYTEARGSKSNWFQVRISHFPTKADARAHGESLKAKGIIDDYYVANYQRPE